MSESQKELRFFKLETDQAGVTLITFDRPPVNALAREVYVDLGNLIDAIEADETTRVAVLTSPPGARAWSGGADLNDLVGLDSNSRLERYALINKTLERFFNLNRPIIAALNNHAVGSGFLLSTLCDFRIASSEAFFSLPEIDRGILANSGGFFFRLRIPQGMMREMIYTGRRYTAEELRPTGIFNHIVPKENVVTKAMEIARLIAAKSLPALKANKAALNVGETMTSWLETYKMGQETSAKLTRSPDAKEGIRAFLEKRKPLYSDK